MRIDITYIRQRAESYTSEPRNITARIVSYLTNLGDGCP